jgi:hypothetical protein
MNWRTLTINNGASATFVSDLGIENGEKVINNAGTLTLLGSGSFSDYSLDHDLVGTFTLNNSGTLIKSDLGAYSLGIIDVNNTGTMNVQAGTLVIPNTLSQTGTLNLASGSTFSKADGFTNQGTISGTGTIDELFRLKHKVTLSGGLARMVGASEIMVNSLHEQALDRIADGLIVEAVAEDGTVEGVRVEGARSFAYGVQFHPEWHVQTDAASYAIFKAFGEACAVYAGGLQRAA